MELCDPNTDAGPGDEDDKVESVIVVTPDVVGRRRKAKIGSEELLDAEDCIEQLRIFNTAHKLPSDVAIHIDRYAHSLRRYQMGSKKKNPTLNTYFKSV